MYYIIKGNKYIHIYLSHIITQSFYTMKLKDSINMFDIFNDYNEAKGNQYLD